MAVLCERTVETSDDSVEKKVAEVLIRFVPENQQVIISHHLYLVTYPFGDHCCHMVQV